MSLKYLVRAAVIVKNKAYYCHVIKPTKFLGKRYSILNRSKYQSLTVFHPPLSPSLQYELIILIFSIAV